MNSYYDIDAILAEEELVPCTTLFDFSHLAHLDPDNYGRFNSNKRHRNNNNNNNRRRGRHNSNGNGNTDYDNDFHDTDNIDDHDDNDDDNDILVDANYLPENSRIKLPMWAIDQWAMLGFVRLSLPRHYGRRARERLEADPGDANLRKWNERFFLSGTKLVNMIETSTKKVAEAIRTNHFRHNGNGSSNNGTNNPRRMKHTQALEQVSREARSLRQTLLKTYGGERLRRTFDWALSSGGDDDVSNYLSHLTEMEQDLFHCGSSAVVAHQQWTLFGNRHLLAGWKNFTSHNSNRSFTPPEAQPMIVDEEDEESDNSNNDFDGYNDDDDYDGISGDDNEHSQRTASSSQGHGPNQREKRRRLG